MIRSLLLFTLIIPILVLAQEANPPAPAEKWLTLSGEAPVVAARGAFSGQFPYGSLIAIDNVLNFMLGAQSIIYCDVQLSKDAHAYCVPFMTLDKTSSISRIFPDGKKTYTINGKKMSGWFPVDYTANDLLNVSYVQHIFSRSNMFDEFLILVQLDGDDGILKTREITSLWLNIQYEEFYKERGISVAECIEKIGKASPELSYISSPEIAMLKSVRLGKKVKRVLQIPGRNEIEPSTKKTYRDILNDLAAIKEFASGIIVPKDYIWPVKSDKYLGAPTTLVDDAHKAGLEVYASLFANDLTISLNYSMDPIMEYLQFIDNSLFSVDGFITDFPPTAQEAIYCFAHNSNAPKNPLAKTVVVSHNGASGEYPGSTDLAYEQAIADGADVIDCSVQMTRDNVAFCMDSPDLTSTTTAITTFMSRSSTVPQIQPKSGIFSFDLHWSEIQTLKPQIFSPFGSYGFQGFPRNPNNKHKGKFQTLEEFIQLAKTRGVPGILISIENAPFLAAKRGIDIIGAVKSTLKNASLVDKKSTLNVTILSSDTQVLSRFKDTPIYQKLFRLEEIIESVPKTTRDEVKKYADGMVVRRLSVMPTSEPDFFLTHQTNVIVDLRESNLTVYVFYLRNEYVALAFDYTSDPTRELATLIAGYGVDGVITDFPATAARYLRNKCYDVAKDLAILPVQPGQLQAMTGFEAPTAAPGPSLEVADVVDAPLPPVDAEATISSPPPPAAPATIAVAPAGAKRSGASGNVVNIRVSIMVVLVIRLLFNVDYY